ncbi:hypothetical protein EJ06DRAFT_68931 [Trichodelitschia bisporula]|uniref:Uncharacterized protein n=1 Tax=Trichodelitschia bisporula TaxID=703511 RepID=A0A6G1HT64_9PEZI|nr:hypothetical protein EJ06DRAFT_68931 [Trichodelitschia bisporula]
MRGIVVVRRKAGDFMPHPRRPKPRGSNPRSGLTRDTTGACASLARKGKTQSRGGDTAGGAYRGELGFTRFRYQPSADATMLTYCGSECWMWSNGAVTGRSLARDSCTRLEACPLCPQTAEAVRQAWRAVAVGKRKFTCVEKRNSENARCAIGPSRQAQGLARLASPARDSHPGFLRMVDKGGVGCICSVHAWAQGDREAVDVLCPYVALCL